MASTAITANLSAIATGGTNFEAVGTMSISMSRPPIEVTQVGGFNSYFLPGVLTSAIALDIYYNKTNHATFTSRLLDGTALPITFICESGDQIVAESALVVGCDIVGSQGDIIRGSISIQVRGSISINGSTSAQGINET